MFWTIAFTVIALLMARVLRPSRPSAMKLETYESGLTTSGETRIRFKISYYLYALAFMIFDIAVRRFSP
jgi:NADH-quinone oxidoreductase subunit A